MVSLRDKTWVWIAGLMWGLLLVVSPAMAAVNMHAAPSGSLMVTASQTVVDTAGHPWQIVLYKHSGASLELEGLTLILNSATDDFKPDPTTPAEIRLPDGTPLHLPASQRGSALNQPIESADVSYDLLAVWSHIRACKHLTLTLEAGIRAQRVIIPIGPQLLQEWHTVASCRALLCAPSS